MTEISVHGYSVYSKKTKHLRPRLFADEAAARWEAVEQVNRQRREHGRKDRAPADWSYCKNRLQLHVVPSTLTANLGPVETDTEPPETPEQQERRRYALAKSVYVGVQFLISADVNREQAKEGQAGLCVLMGAILHGGKAAVTQDHPLHLYLKRAFPTDQHHTPPVWDYVKINPGE